MARKYSDSLTRFRELTKSYNKRRASKKIEAERRDLLFWYVDNCPSHDGPEISKKFADYGIKNGSDFGRLKRHLIDTIGLKNKETYNYCENGKTMESLIEEIERVFLSRRKAIIFFSKDRYGEMDSLYKRIRNSFAHGNYFKVKDYYYLWNETGSGTKKLGSFMVLATGENRHSESGEINQS